MAGNLGYTTWVAADAVACFERADWETGELLAGGEAVKRLALSELSLALDQLAVRVT